MNTQNTHKRIARVFEDVGGFYYCDANLSYLDTRGARFETVGDAIRSIEGNNMFIRSPYTHYVRGNVTRRLKA